MTDDKVPKDYYEKGSTQVTEVSAVTLKKLAQVCDAKNELHMGRDDWASDFPYILWKDLLQQDEFS